MLGRSTRVIVLFPRNHCNLMTYELVLRDLLLGCRPIGIFSTPMSTGPQTSFFDSVKEYDLVISMDQIPLLPKALGDHDKFRGPKKMPPFPELNVSRIPFANGLYSKESLDLVFHIYRNDYKSLIEAGIPVEPKRVARAVELSKFRDTFHKSRENIILARQENRIIRMEDQLDAVYRSLSWRMTAPLRFLFRGLK